MVSAPAGGGQGKRQARRNETPVTFTLSHNGFKRGALVPRSLRRRAATLLAAGFTDLLRTSLVADAHDFSKATAKATPVRVTPAWFALETQDGDSPTDRTALDSTCNTPCNRSPGTWCLVLGARCGKGTNDGCVLATLEQIVP